MERIERVFIELLQTKELGEITVSDICKRCNLNRSTFYANYMDVYDLADKTREHLEQEVAGLYEAERAKGFNSNDFLRLFQHIQNNQSFYHVYFKLGYDDSHVIELYDVGQADLYFGNQHIAYHIAFFKNGFNAIVKMWLAGGCKETPEELDKIIHDEYQGRLRSAHKEKTDRQTLNNTI